MSSSRAIEIVNSLLEGKRYSLLRDIALSTVDAHGKYHAALTAWKKADADTGMSRRGKWESVVRALWPGTSERVVVATAVKLFLADAELYSLSIYNDRDTVNDYIEHKIPSCISRLPADKNKTEALVRLWRTFSNE